MAQGQYTCTAESVQLRGTAVYELKEETGTTKNKK
jgi:hypothetical protein